MGIDTQVMASPLTHPKEDLIKIREIKVLPTHILNIIAESSEA